MSRYSLMIVVWIVHPPILYHSKKLPALPRAKFFFGMTKLNSKPVSLKTFGPKKPSQVSEDGSRGFGLGLSSGRQTVIAGGDPTADRTRT